MDIKGLEIKFSKIGINSVSTKGRQVVYIPVIVILHEEGGKTKKKRIYLSAFVKDKRSVKQIIASETFISLLIDDDFKFFTFEGELSGTVSATKYGKLLQVNDDNMVLLKGSTATWLNDKAEIVKTMEMTEEELKRLQ